MILCKLEDVQRYKGMHPNIDKAIDFMINTELASLPLGKTEIMNDDIYVNRFSYFGTKLEEGFFEAHVAFLDIHFVLEGCEQVGVSDITKLTYVEHEEENDFWKYDGKPDVICPLHTNEMVFTFPEDAHMPHIEMDAQKIEKLVFKVRI